MLMGVPARVVRELTETEVLSMRETAERYVGKAKQAKLKNSPIKFINI